MAGDLIAENHAFTCMQHWYNSERWRDGRCSVRNRLHASVCPVILDSALRTAPPSLNFRHLLEQHQLAGQLFKTINPGWPKRASRDDQGTLVDTTIIEAPVRSRSDQEKAKWRWATSYNAKKLT